MNFAILKVIYCELKISNLVNSLFWFDNDFEIDSKYHHNTVVLLLTAHILSLQDVVFRSMFLEYVNHIVNHSANDNMDREINMIFKVNAWQ